MIEAEDILEVMGKQARKVCQNVFPQQRPNASTKKLTEFIVVSLPYSESNKTIGENDDWWLDETVVFEIYVADDKTADDPKRLNLKRLTVFFTTALPSPDENLAFSTGIV